MDNMMKKSGKPMKKMTSFPPAKAPPKFRPTFDSRRFEDMKMESDNDGDEQKVKKAKKPKF